MQIKLLKHQKEFCEDYETRYLALVAGFGSGKTHAFCIKTILMAAKNTGYVGAVMEPTYGMLERVLIPEMERTLEELRIPYKYKASTMTFTLQFKEGETIVRCLAAENYRRMAGMNLAFFGVDECDTIKKEIARAMWNMAMSRLRKGRVYQGFTTSTPEGFSFLYEFFVEQVSADRRLIKGRTADNPYLPPDFIESLLANYPPNLIKAYLEGEFTNLTSGQVYYAFDRIRNNTTKTLADFPNHVIHIGQDFNVGKCSSTVHVIDNGIPYLLEEIMGARDSAQVVSIIRQRYAGRRVIIYPDASGGSNKTNAALTDIAHFKQAGFEIRASSKNPFVRDRVNSVNAKFSNNSYFVNVLQCPFTVKALEQQVYNKAGEPDKEHDQDHPVDALGYFIWQNFPLISKSKIYSY
jgi:hypothetical protein